MRHLIRDEPWWFWARDDQLPPPAPWRTWVFLGGRGAGKTRAGAEWLTAQIAGGVARAAVVGPTLADVREVMADGPSGLMALSRPGAGRPVYEPSRRRIVWPNGAVALAFSAEEPDRIRGAQIGAAWCDEFCAWRDPDYALAMLQMALRDGPRPQMVVTTTPRPLPALTALIKAGDTVLTRAGMRANAANLSPAFVAAIEAAYGDGVLGRQELDGEIIEDAPGALWSYETLSAALAPDLPRLDRVVVGLDPPASVGPNADACGVIVAGAAGEGRARTAWVLADRTVQGLAPDAWAAQVVAAARGFEAACVVAEVNQGGAMVAEVLALADPGVVVKPVWARRGKQARAEPVAALYAQGRVKHAGRFAALEAELRSFGAAGPTTKSPDRVDALVWAIRDLLLDAPGVPRLRTLD